MVSKTELYDCKFIDSYDKKLLILYPKRVELRMRYFKCPILGRLLETTCHTIYNIE